MTDKNITELPTTSTLGSSDSFHISQGGVDKKIDASDVLAGIEGGSPFNVIPKDVSGTTYQILLGDKDCFLQCLNASGCAVTLPNFTNAPFQIGDQVTVKNDGDGIVTFLLDSGVTLRESTVGSTLDTKGQAATFVNVGTNIWNMVSGGVGGSGGFRQKVVRSSDVGRTDDGSPVLVVDGQLEVTGLTSGTTYKVDATLEITNTGGSDGSMLYYVGPTTYLSLPSGDFITHLIDDNTGPAINVDSFGSLPNSVINVASGGGQSFARITGEVTVPSGENSIGVYWDSTANLETVVLKEGSTLTVESA